MSAWLVSRRHIDALVTATRQLPRWGDTPWSDDPDELGRMLWGECLKSVSSRYPRDGDGEWPGPAGLTRAEIAGYTYTPPTRTAGGETGAPAYDHATLLKAIDCYEYQSSEHDGWRKSIARKLCGALRDHLIGTLPGYSAAPWGIT